MNEMNVDNGTINNRPDRKAHTIDLLLVLVFCVAFLGYRLGQFVPLTDHEGLVAVTAEEAYTNGHWIVPHFNGQRRLQKTPLMYWAVAGLGYLFGGIDEFTVRLPAAISAGAVALMMTFLAARMFDRVTGLITGLATASCTGILWQSHRGTHDMLMTAFVVASMVCFWLALEGLASGKESRKYFLLAYASFAVAMLAKGPLPAPVVGLPILAYIIWSGDYKRLVKFQLHWGLLIFVVIVGWWVVAVLVSVDDVIYRWYEEFIARAIGQFGTKRPWYYYLPQIFLLTLPWSVFLPLGLILPFRRDIADHRKGLVFVFIWLVADLVFFSVCEGKRAHYILPIVPPAVILSVGGLTFALNRWGSARSIKITMLSAVIITAVVASCVGFLWLWKTYPHAMKGYYWVIGIVLAMEVLAGVAYLRWGGLALATVVALASGLCFAVIWPMYPLLSDPARDPKRASELLKEKIGTDAEIYFIGRANAQLVFYYGKAMPSIPTDQEKTRLYLKVTDRRRAMEDLIDLTVERVLGLLRRDGRRYFICPNVWFPAAEVHAEKGGLKIYEILRVPRFFSRDSSLVLFSNHPPSQSQPTTTSTAN